MARRLTSTADNKENIIVDQQPSQLQIAVQQDVESALGALQLRVISLERENNFLRQALEAATASDPEDNDKP